MYPCLWDGMYLFIHPSGSEAGNCVNALVPIRRCCRQENILGSAGSLGMIWGNYSTAYFNYAVCDFIG